MLHTPNFSFLTLPNLLENNPYASHLQNQPCSWSIHPLKIKIRSMAKCVERQSYAIVSWFGRFWWAERPVFCRKPLVCHGEVDLSMEVVSTIYRCPTFLGITLVEYGRLSGSFIWVQETSCFDNILKSGSSSHYWGPGLGNIFIGVSAIWWFGLCKCCLVHIFRTLV